MSTDIDKAYTINTVKMFNHLQDRSKLWIIFNGLGTMIFQTTYEEVPYCPNNQASFLHSAVR